jgi:presenilin-like A22 family membrane protease
MIKLIDERDIDDIFAMFAIVLGIGLLLVYLIVSTSNIALVRETITSPHSVYLSYVLDIVLVAVVVLMLLNRHRRHPIANNRLFIVFEGTVVIATSVFFFIALFDLILPRATVGYSVEISVLAAVVLVAVKEMHPKVRNLVTMVSSIGVGLFIGLYVNFGVAMLILAVIAIYDYLAVFVTKSMLKLAGVIEEEDIALVISSSHIDVVPASNYSRKEVLNYLKNLHIEKKDKNPIIRRILSMGELPVISQVQLGEGDIGLPLMAIVSAYFTFGNLFVSYAILIGSLVGLFAATYALQHYKKPLPAIPPIFFFIFVSSALALEAVGLMQPVLPVMVASGIVATIAFVLADRTAMKHKRRRLLV